MALGHRAVVARTIVFIALVAAALPMTATVVVVTTATPAAAAPATTTFAAGTFTSYVVPDGYQYLRVVARGGHGGGSTGLTPTAGGRGANITADIPVPANRTLLVTVGANGATSTAHNGDWLAGGAGGALITNPYGTAVASGGQGGGGSAVWTDCGLFGCLTPLVVAAGGGGAGVGGSGGDAGASGANGAALGAGAAGGGGGAGTASAPGAGGPGGWSGGNGTAGESPWPFVSKSGDGGDGMVDDSTASAGGGGGGGGGYNPGGGGGGGYSNWSVFLPPLSRGAGGGGGGGYSFVGPNLRSTVGLDGTSRPIVTITPFNSTSATTVDCETTTRIGRATPCEVVVTGEPGWPAQGSVDLTLSHPSHGTVPATCTLDAAGHCAFTFVPSVQNVWGPKPTITVTASYAGSSDHFASSAVSEAIVVHERPSVTLDDSCSGPIVVGQSVSCTVRIGYASFPLWSDPPVAGSAVTFRASGGTGSFSPGPSCVTATTTCTVTYTPSSIGDHTVTASWLEVEGSRVVSVVEPVPVALDVTAPSTATAGSPFAVTVTARDAAGQSVIGYTGTVQFSSSDGGAALPADYTFGPADAGSHTFDLTLFHAGPAATVAVTDGTLTGAAAVGVTPGPLEHVTVAPGESSIASGDSQHYTASGFDAYGNDLGDVTTGATFSITPDGSCTGSTCSATKAGDHTVIATNGAASDAATLHVVAAGLATLTFASPATSVTAGDSASFLVDGADAYGNDLGDLTAGTAFTIAPDGSCAGAVCTATVAGPHTVTATNGGAVTQAVLDVVPAALDRLIVTPSPSTVEAGTSQQYTALGFDVYDNPIGDVSAATAFAIGPDGSCAGAVCTATIAGPHAVTATNGGATASADLVVVPADVAYLTITPAAATVTAGTGQAYTVEGADAYGNAIGDVTTATVFTIGPDGSCAGAVCTDTTAGHHTVAATNGGATASADLVVVPAALDHLTVTPDAATATAGSAQTYVAMTYDAYGNLLGDVTQAATLAIAPDGRCADASCSATVAGPHQVTATFGTLTDTVDLIVVAGPVREMRLSPASTTVRLGTAQPYVATTYDKYGNRVEDVTNATSFSVSSGSCDANACTPARKGKHVVYGVHGRLEAVAELIAR